MKAQNRTQMIVAVVVAFALGAGVGFFVEHERLKNKTHKATGATADATGWFASATAACPALKSWQSAAANSYVATLRKASWSTTQGALLASETNSVNALKAMLPHATPTGRNGLNLMITRATKTSTALKSATSLAGYEKAAKTLKTPLDTALLNRAAGTCSKTSTTT
jgi:hypothetical protein